MHPALTFALSEARRLEVAQQIRDLRRAGAAPPTPTIAVAILGRCARA